MDTINSMTDEGFFSYVFKLSKFKQADLLNFIQYSTLSILPFLLLYYLIKKFSFSSTYTSSSLYIISITLLPIILFIIGIYIIDRFVNFIPTLSGKFYDAINLTNISILIIIILLLSSGGYQERTSILLHRFGRFFGADNYILKMIGVKNIPEFERYDGEENQLYYEIAYNKAKNKAKEMGANDEKADEIGITIATKLKELKKIQHTIDAKEIIKINDNISSASLGTNSGYGQNNTDNASSMMNMPAQMPAQMPTQMPTQMPAQNAPYTGVKTNEGMYSSDGGSGEPEAANGALGGSGFSTW
jgi:hypothetical protein